MVTIVFPLKLQMQNRSVGDLQEALVSLGSAIVANEQQAMHFGATTRQAVLEFQMRHGLTESGEVDAGTAHRLNEVLKSSRTPGTGRTYSVRGRILSADGQPAAGVVVRAFDQDVAGHAHADIIWHWLPQPSDFLRTILWFNPFWHTFVEHGPWADHRKAGLPIAHASTNRLSDEEKLCLALSIPSAEALQRVAQAALLGEATTDTAGRYEIRYAESKFRQSPGERGGPELFVLVSDPGGRPLGHSNTVKDAARDLQLDLTLPVLPTVVPNVGSLDIRYSLLCRVVDARGDSIAGLRIEAFDQDPNSPHASLGETATSDSDGMALIRFKRSDLAESLGNRGLDLSFKVYRGETLLNYALPNVENCNGVLRNFQQQREALVVQVDRHYVVSGVIAQANRVPAKELKLLVHCVGFGGKSNSLGSPITDAFGHYHLAYDPGPGAVNLEMRIPDPANPDQTLSLMKPRFGAAPQEVLNLVAPAKPQNAEYRRLSTTLLPHVGKMSKLADAQENAERRDLTVLNRATAWDARLIALAALSERLCADPDLLKEDLSREAVYGLLRAGLPSAKELLARIAPNTVEEALKMVRDAEIVALSDEEIASFKKRFVSFANTARLSSPAPGSNSSYSELLEASQVFTGNEAARNRFAAVLFNHRGDAAQLWEKAGKKAVDGGAELKIDQIAKLQLHGKLAFLAGNSALMTGRLMDKFKDRQIADPVHLIEADFHRAETWVKELLTLADKGSINLDKLIPVDYAGENVDDRLNTYAQDMARKIRLSYPTQVLARLIETDEPFSLLARPEIVPVLKRAAGQGFRLGKTPVATFIKVHTGVLDGLTEQERHVATGELETLYRLYQITPTSEAMPALKSMGVTAASDAIVYSTEDFQAQYSAAYTKLYNAPPPVDEAALIYRRAAQLSWVAFNVSVMARQIGTYPLLNVLSSQDEKQLVKSELIRHYPTIESLFGSMDFCECEHCRSVLSPAAYLVDLLQSLEEWGKPYEILVARRPDIPHIQLTCENTNTVLPYIDVGNEILEYFVAKGKLEEETAKDIGEATTAELLAEPQNVIRDAYDKLVQAKYPLNLPFDLWIETVRQFCNYFEMPLNRVLEVFRCGEGLAARVPALMESLGLSPTELAIFTQGDALEPDWWYELYGLPINRVTISNPTNQGSATVSVPNEATNRFREGMAWTYPSAPGKESKAILSVGTPNSGGQGKTKITFKGVWSRPPSNGDLLVCDGAATLKSAKVLSRRLGVTYKEITDIVQTGFVNPDLSSLSLLYKLGVSVQQARFFKENSEAYKQKYVQNEDLLKKDTQAWTDADKETISNIGRDDWTVLLELNAFRQRLQKFAEQFASAGLDAAVLEAQVKNLEFKDILVLRDPNVGCNFHETTLESAEGSNAEPIVFLRINLFVRLWRKLGWTIEEMDRALQIFMPRRTLMDAAHLTEQPFKTALIYLAYLKALDEKLKVGKQSRIKLLTLWSNIATTGKKPLYAELFLTSSVLKTAPVFDHPLGQYLTNPNIYLKNHTLALQGALGLAAEEIPRILSDAGVVFDTARLSLPNVSLLYKYGLLAKALGLTVGELIALKQLSGLNPFEPLVTNPLATLQIEPVEPLVTNPLATLQIEPDYSFSPTLEFVKVAEEVKDSGMNVEDLDYLIRHRFGEAGKYRPDREGVLALLKALAKGVRAVQTEHAVPDDPGALSDEALRQKLGLALPADVVAKFTAMMNGTAEFSVTRPVAIADQLDPADFQAEPSITVSPYNSTKEQQSLIHRGVLFEPHKTSLKNKFSPNLENGQKAAFEALLDDAQTKAQKDADAFFVKYLRKQTAGIQPVFGFLDAADYELLFSPAPNNLDDAQEQARERTRRTRLVQAFLPFLQQRLIRQFIVQTVTAQMGADPAVLESLLIDGRLMKDADSTPLISALIKTGARGMTATHWFSADQTGVALTTQPQPRLAWKSTDTLSNPFQVLDTTRSELDGYLEVPSNHDYVFSVVLANTDDKVDLRIGESPVTEMTHCATQNQKTFDVPPITLQPGTRYPIRVVVTGAGAAQAIIKTRSGTQLPAACNSCRVGAYMEVPTPGAYRFYAEMGDTDATAILTFPHLPHPELLKAGKVDEFLELKAGVLYRFSLDLKNLKGRGAQLMVQGESLPKAPLSQMTLYPAAAMDAAERAMTLLAKAVQLVQSMGLHEREIRYVLTHGADFGGVNLGALPTEPVGDTQAEKDATKQQFKGFRSLARYARLKRDMVGGADDLISVLETDGEGDFNATLALIAKLTRREKATVERTAAVLFGQPGSLRAKSLGRLWESLQVVERFGVPPASLQEWTGIVSASATPGQRFEIARDLKEAIKARFEPETWHRVAQPIFDKLRQRQRDALVAHVMHQHAFDRMEQLYEYFLIDPGMEPVVQTSRIRLAIASVQLFIQRCLLNMEPEVHSSAINSKHWDWMKRYRVWEANRKIFLFPENWLEPEFRDDKTHLFQELEGTLLQGDVSSDLVEDAFFSYLRRLDELARLDIVAMCVEDKTDPAVGTLHVFGRTFSQPHKYFYRRYSTGMWTPWEPVSAEIAGDHLAPIVWRDRLYLFWVTFIEKPYGSIPINDRSQRALAVQQESDTPPSQMPLIGPPPLNKEMTDKMKGKVSDIDFDTILTLAGAGPIELPNSPSNNTTSPSSGPLAGPARLMPYKTVEAQLHWSEYLHGEWSTNESVGLSAVISRTVESSFTPDSVFVHVSKDPGDDKRGVYVHLSQPFSTAFYLAGRNSMPEEASYIEPPRIPFNYSGQPLATRYVCSGALGVNTGPKSGDGGKPVLEGKGRFALLACANLPAADLATPNFFQDDQYSLFLEPRFTQPTVETWESSVEPSGLDSEPDVEGPAKKDWPVTTPHDDPLDWIRKNIRVNPAEIYRDAKIRINEARDWALNHQNTGIMFGEEIIGPTGWSGLRTLGDEVSSAVRISPASTVAARVGVAIVDQTAFSASGLVTSNTGLHVVGREGLSLAVAPAQSQTIMSKEPGAGLSGAGRITR